MLVLLRHLLPCWGQTGLPVLVLLPPPCLRLLQHPLLCPRAPGRRDQPWGDTGVSQVPGHGSSGAQGFGHSRAEEQVVQPWGDRWV